MSESELQAENEKLRAENESFRQREMADLRAALAAAQEAAQHYRAEAQRAVENFHKLDAMDKEKIARLEAELSAVRQMQTRRKPARANA